MLILKIISYTNLITCLQIDLFYVDYESWWLTFKYDKLVLKSIETNQLSLFDVIDSDRSSISLNIHFQNLKWISKLNQLWSILIEDQLLNYLNQKLFIWFIYKDDDNLQLKTIFRDEMLWNMTGEEPTTYCSRDIWRLADVPLFSVSLFMGYRQIGSNYLDRSDKQTVFKKTNKKPPKINK